jgi:hypothetical protein
VQGGFINTAIVKARQILAAFLLVLGSVPGSLVSAGEPSPPPVSESRPVVSEHLRATLKRANDALNSKNYELVLVEVDAADAMQPKSQFDQYVIDQMRAFAKAQLSKQSQ